MANQHVDFSIETQRVPVGKHPTDETRAKLSAAAKKRWQDPGLSPIPSLRERSIIWPRALLKN